MSDVPSSGLLGLNFNSRDCLKTSKCPTSQVLVCLDATSKYMAYFFTSMARKKYQKESLKSASNAKIK